MRRLINPGLQTFPALCRLFRLGGCPRRPAYYDAQPYSPIPFEYPDRPAFSGSAHPRRPAYYEAEPYSPIPFEYPDWQAFTGSGSSPPPRILLGALAPTMTVQ